MPAIPEIAPADAQDLQAQAVDNGVQEADDVTQQVGN